MIKEICYKLKEKREKLGYSLEYTVEKTKLHPSVIKDIENCNLTNISPAYLKGFIRIYASFLGVELGEVLKDIDSLKPTFKKTKVVREASRKTFANSKAKFTKLISPRIKKRILIIAVAVVSLWCFFVISNFAVKKISQFFKRSTPIAKENSSQISLVPPEANKLTVSLAVKKKCFLKVIVDGELYFKGVLRKGVRETWRGKRQIELKISDGSAVDLEVNGKSLPPLTSLHKPIKSLKITPSGISVDK